MELEKIINIWVTDKTQARRGFSLLQTYDVNTFQDLIETMYAYSPSKWKRLFVEDMKIESIKLSQKLNKWYDINKPSKINRLMYRLRC
jgi:hypothetical protein